MDKTKYQHSRIDSGLKTETSRSAISQQHPDDHHQVSKESPVRNDKPGADKVHSSRVSAADHTAKNQEENLSGGFSNQEQETEDGKTNGRRDADFSLSGRTQRSFETTLKSNMEPLPQRHAEVAEHIRNAIILKYQSRNQAGFQTSFHIERGPLGKMDIRFRNDKGESKVTIVVENEAAKTELMRYLPSIQQGLQEKGVSLSELSINVNQFADKDRKEENNQSNQAHTQKNAGKEDYDENIAHPETKRNYGYNTMEVIA
jgi:hypothetical protein